MLLHDVGRCWRQVWGLPSTAAAGAVCCAVAGGAASLAGPAAVGLRLPLLLRRTGCLAATQLLVVILSLLPPVDTAQQDLQAAALLAHALQVLQAGEGHRRRQRLHERAAHSGLCLHRPHAHELQRGPGAGRHGLRLPKGGRHCSSGAPLLLPLAATRFGKLWCTCVAARSAAAADYSGKARSRPVWLPASMPNSKLLQVTDLG